MKHLPTVGDDAGARFSKWQRGAVAPWLMSLTIHSSLLVAVAISPASVKQPATADLPREGAIVLVARVAGHADYFSDELEPGRDSNAGANAAPAIHVELPTDHPPPTTGPRLPTTSATPGSAASASSAPPISVTSGQTSAKSGRPYGRGSDYGVETQVFGVRGKGTRFVYVFDRSSSMEGAPLAVAKQELVASLQSLQNVHQFQIIFYNQQPHVMPAFRGSSPEMVFGDEQGRRLAANFIGGIFADGGTDHMQALTTALRMQPDVIFFLTDADEPMLRSDDFAHIQRLNKGTLINAIEFGVGPPKRQYSFLAQLAAENGGQHSYVDVNRLRR